MRMATHAAMPMHGHGVPALEMTKWFDTNYHYMVPELDADSASRSPRASRSTSIGEAKALGYQTRPVLLGPVTYLKLGKSKDAGFDPLSLLTALLPVYVEVLRELAARGADWVQIDEPCLVLDLDAATRDGACSGLCAIRDARAAAEDHAGDLFRCARRQSRHGASRCRWQACTSISCARPEQLDDVVASARRIACCRSA